MQLKSGTASEESKRQTLQKPRNRVAAENTEAFKAVYKWLDTREISEDAAENEKAVQSKQAAM